MIYSNLAISIITLNRNSSNSPIKRQRLSDWMEKNKDNYILPSKKCKDKSMYHANTGQKKAGVAILISKQISKQRIIRGIKVISY